MITNMRLNPTEAMQNAANNAVFTASYEPLEVVKAKLEANMMFMVIMDRVNLALH
jgi:hypothetical protein